MQAIFQVADGNLAVFPAPLFLKVYRRLEIEVHRPPE